MFCLEDKMRKCAYDCTVNFFAKLPNSQTGNSSPKNVSFSHLGHPRCSWAFVNCNRFTMYTTLNCCFWSKFRLWVKYSFKGATKFFFHGHCLMWSLHLFTYFWNKYLYNLAEKNVLTVDKVNWCILKYLSSVDFFICYWLRATCITLSVVPLWSWRWQHPIANPAVIFMVWTGVTRSLLN